ncbi:DUF547 domain-containing protein [Tepidiforma sp.]|uniref:DUF547 domain-containing protein n=1 Tax=Tepidiforma sp. TaxID=2682230 RepID=UPI002ADE38E0|nr:DUF547 domain-containing protein [Tepidiforma sp.]
MGHSLHGAPLPAGSATTGAVALSQQLLRAVRAGQGTAEFEALATLSEGDLRRSLATDADKLAFWINVYNAGIQRVLAESPDRYSRRLRFFSTFGVEVAGHHLTFNAIEHGMLRRSMFAFSLGYMANPFPGRFERAFRLQRRDPRVHFALNCGAASCPPIAFYDPALIDAQLDLAAHSYLDTTTSYDPATNTVTVTRLFLWFRGDFGGPAGIRRLLARYEQIPPGSAPRLHFAPYDWTLSLDNYAPG